MLRCLGENEVALVFKEVYKGAYNSHIGEKALPQKLLRAGYYFPMLMKYSLAFVKRCNPYQRNTDLHHTPVEFLQSMTFPWTFF